MIVFRKVPKILHDHIQFHWRNRNIYTLKQDSDGWKPTQALALQIKSQALHVQSGNSKFPPQGII